MGRESADEKWKKRRILMRLKESGIVGLIAASQRAVNGCCCGRSTILPADKSILGRFGDGKPSNWKSWNWKSRKRDNEELEEG